MQQDVNKYIQIYTFIVFYPEQKHAINALLEK